MNKCVSVCINTNVYLRILTYISTLIYALLNVEQNTHITKQKLTVKIVFYSGLNEGVSIWWAYFQVGSNVVKYAPLIYHDSSTFFTMSKYYIFFVSNCSYYLMLVQLLEDLLLSEVYLEVFILQQWWCETNWKHNLLHLLYVYIHWWLPIHGFLFFFQNVVPIFYIWHVIGSTNLWWKIKELFIVQITSPRTLTSL